MKERQLMACMHAGLQLLADHQSGWARFHPGPWMASANRRELACKLA